MDCPYIKGAPKLIRVHLVTHYHHPSVVGETAISDEEKPGKCVLVCTLLFTVASALCVLNLSWGNLNIFSVSELDLCKQHRWA